MTTTPIANITEYAEDQDLGHVTINSGFRALEQAGGLIVESRTVTDPSTLTPSDGEAWIVGSSAVGLWFGHDGEVAWWESGWKFRDLRNGETFTSLGDGSNGTFYANNGGTHVSIATW